MCVSTEVTFPLGGFLGQDMATVRLGTLEFALTVAAKSFRCATVSF